MVAGPPKGLNTDRYGVQLKCCYYMGGWRWGKMIRKKKSYLKRFCKGGNMEKKLKSID